MTESHPGLDGRNMSETAGGFAFVHLQGIRALEVNTPSTLLMGVPPKGDVVIPSFVSRHHPLSEAKQYQQQSKCKATYKLPLLSYTEGKPTREVSLSMMLHDQREKRSQTRCTTLVERRIVDRGLTVSRCVVHRLPFHESFTHEAMKWLVELFTTMIYNTSVPSSTTFGLQGINPHG